MLHFNQALLGKWLWCFATKRDALWRRVVECKYGSNWGGWCSKERSKGTMLAYGSIFVRAGLDFPGVSFLVGQGTHVKFWHNWWCGEGRLRTLFLIFTVLLRIRGWQWQIIYVGMGILWCGMCLFYILCRIASWRH